MRNLKILSLLIITIFIFLTLFVFPKKISAQGYFTCVWIDKNPQTGEPLSQGACGPIPATYPGSTEFCDSGYNLDYAACYNLAKTEDACNSLSGRHFDCKQGDVPITSTSQPISSAKCKYDAGTKQCLECDIATGESCQPATGSSECLDYCEQQAEVISRVVSNLCVAVLI